MQAMTRYVGLEADTARREARATSGRRAPRTDAPLTHFASPHGEKSGLVDQLKTAVLQGHCRREAPLRQRGPGSRLADGLVVFVKNPPSKRAGLAPTGSFVPSQQRVALRTDRQRWVFAAVRRPAGSKRPRRRQIRADRGPVNLPFGFPSGENATRAFRETHAAHRTGLNLPGVNFFRAESFPLVARCQQVDIAVNLRRGRAIEPVECSPAVGERPQPAAAARTGSWGRRRTLF